MKINKCDLICLFFKRKKKKIEISFNFALGRSLQFRLTFTKAEISNKLKWVLFVLMLKKGQNLFIEKLPMNALRTQGNKRRDSQPSHLHPWKHTHKITTFTVKSSK